MLGLTVLLSLRQDPLFFVDHFFVFDLNWVILKKNFFRRINPTEAFSHTQTQTNSLFSFFFFQSLCYVSFLFESSPTLFSNVALFKASSREGRIEAAKNVHKFVAINPELVSMQIDFFSLSKVNLKYPILWRRNKDFQKTFIY